MLARARGTFVGRARELRLIGESIAAHRQLITLLGEPGIGKTRLAMEFLVAEAQAPACRTRWVSLESADSPQQVLDAIAGQLDIAHLRPARLDRLVDALGTQRVLLVLDSFEHVLAAAPCVAALVAGCPGLVVLVTSRSPLQLPGEHVITLGPLTLPPKTQAPATGAERTDAVRLFMDRAASALPGYSADAEPEAAAVADICRRLDGNPLAIELAASRLRLLPGARTLLTRMDWGVLPLLERGTAAGPLRHSSMAAAIEWSVRCLEEPARRLLRRLSVFEGSFTIGAADWLNADPSTTTTTTTPPHDVVRLIDALLLHGLLRPAPSTSSDVRFVMPWLIREFGRDRLGRSHDLGLVERRFVAWFVDLAETAEGALRGTDQATWLARLDDELPNLRAVLRRAEENDEAEVGIRIASALRTYWIARGAAAEGRDWLSRFRTRPRPAAPRRLRAPEAGTANGSTAAAAEPDDQRGAQRLTARERQVAVLIARGLKDREIAEALVMSRATASWHVRNVLSKIGRPRVQVGMWAFEHGLLDAVESRPARI